MQYYSQNLEDKYVLDYFAGSTGRLLELGANDGKTLSNSLALIESGWSAVLVEPSETFGNLAMQHLENQYVWAYRLAIGNVDGEMNFKESGELLGTGDRALVSTLDPKETRRWPKMEYREYPVTVKTFASFLQQLSKDKVPTSFKYISIDIEGLDLAVLKQINFDQTETECVTVEYNGINESDYYRTVKPYGFRLLHKNAENLIYVR